MKLQRTEQNAFATYGVMIRDDGAMECVTLEHPWRENRHGVSCIPAGAYTATKRFSPKHNMDVFWVDGVPDRQAIEIHVGNLPADTEGCILVGSQRGMVQGKDGVEHPGITGSKAAFAKLMADFAGVDSFPLDVMDAEPTA
jgi:hypothetical protein